MGEVVPLLPMLDERKIYDALREITDETTETIVIITVSQTSIGVRSFGHEPLVAVQAAERASPASRLAEMERAIETLRAALMCVAETAQHAAGMSLESLSAPAERWPA